MDLSSLPPLTDEQRAELEALAAMPDESVDFSDIAPADEELGALADAAKGAADRAGSAIDDAMAYIAASNKRIASMESAADPGPQIKSKIRYSIACNLVPDPPTTFSANCKAGVLKGTTLRS
jgi:hypothetical protein